MFFSHDCLHTAVYKRIHFRLSPTPTNMLNYLTRRVFVFIRFLWLPCLLFLVIASQKYSSLKSSLVSFINVTVPPMEENNLELDQVVQFLLSKNITKIEAEADGDYDEEVVNHILNTHLYLKQENITFVCEALDLEKSTENYER